LKDLSLVTEFHHQRLDSLVGGIAGKSYRQQHGHEYQNFSFHHLNERIFTFTLFTDIVMQVVVHCASGRK
jgi:hypothetical protein